MGLSPLARGNRRDHVDRLAPAGPIPAGAGQPCAPSARPTRTRAYPRWRGATHLHVQSPTGCAGLSPLARGNLRPELAGKGLRGPIPAGAGQPPARSAPPRSSGAYPRWRGATGFERHHALNCSGLSPLARGNRIGVEAVRQIVGPIPAGAGQPCAPAGSGWGAWAYPRWRGATTRT